MTFLGMPKTHRPFSSRILGTLGAGLLRTLIPTYRFVRVGKLTPELALSGPLALVFWHEQQLLMPHLFVIMGREETSKGLVALASGHRDGQIIGQIAEWCGFRTMTGSSSKGGLASLMALGRCLKAGYDIGMAPDGPKGPAGKSKQGIVALARKYSVSIVPVSYAVCERSIWRFDKAWDKMFLPKPFAKVYWGVGPILRFDPEQELEAGMLILDAEIRRLNEVVLADVAR